MLIHVSVLSIIIINRIDLLSIHVYLFALELFCLFLSIQKWGEGVFFPKSEQLCIAEVFDWLGRAE